ncbi:MAG: SH3 domain-containing protein [bacterium]|nr:SH3 domain-containing protein [bacterium]
MSWVKELAREIREGEDPLLASYEALMAAATTPSEKKLARIVHAYQRFQIKSLDLFEREVPEKFLAFAVITQSEVNLREGPGPREQVARQLDKGTPVILMEYAGFWARVQLGDGGTGYVFKDYVRAEAQD